MSNNPYQSPVAESYAGSTALPNFGHQYNYKSLRLLTILLVICTVWIVITGMLISSLELICESIWPGFNDPNLEFADETAQMVAILMFGGVGLLSLIPGLAVMVLGPMFSYRSNANLRSLDVNHLEYTPGWCAGFWFLPIYNLFRPYQATREVYQASQDILPDSSATSMSPFLGWWWFFYISGNVVSAVETRMAMQGLYFPETFHLISFLSSGLMLLAGILYIRIVLRISANQSAAARSLFGW